MGATVDFACSGVESNSVHAAQRGRNGAALYALEQCWEHADEADDADAAEARNSVQATHYGCNTVGNIISTFNNCSFSVCQLLC